MKKLLFALTLTLISTHTMAEWTKIGESDDDEGYTVYAEMDSVRKSGDRVRMWILLDYKTEQKASGVNFLSKTIRRDYDCKGEHLRTLAFKLFSWNMGQGSLVRSYNQPRNWKNAQSESMDETVWKFACSQ